MDNKKYELTEESIEIDGHKLFRIRALKDFDGVEKGDLGGYVESESNLSHAGNCWIYDNAKCYGYSELCDNSKLFDNSELYDNACMYDNSSADRTSKIYGGASIEDNAIISNSHIYGKSIICDDARICTFSMVSDNARVCGSSIICDNSEIYGNAEIDGLSMIEQTEIYGNIKISNARITCAVLSEPNSVIVVSNIGSRNDSTTFYKQDTGIRVMCGCFEGTIKEFKKTVLKTHKDLDNRIYKKQYLKTIRYAKRMLK